MRSFARHQGALNCSQFLRCASWLQLCSGVGGAGRPIGLFTEDADQHTTGGEWRRGRVQIVPGTLESSTRNPGLRRITVTTVRFITADVAIADGPYEIGARRMWTTIVLKREASVWRTAAIRNMVPTGSQPQDR